MGRGSTRERQTIDPMAMYASRLQKYEAVCELDSNTDLGVCLQPFVIFLLIFSR
jgi:hypothetical protein